MFLLNKCTFPIFLLLLSTSCKLNREPAGNETGSPPPSDLMVVADPIVYDVEIINPTPEDQWTEECLAGLDRESLLEFIFGGIYEGDFEVYGIFGGKQISAKKIRKMEEAGEFSRERIGKIQFQEEWVLDPVKMSFSKQVTEIRLGLQTFLPDGTFKNYSPLFRVVLQE